MGRDTVAKTASLWASWPLSTGTDYSDESSHTYTLTPHGTPTTSATDPTQGTNGDVAGVVTAATSATIVPTVTGEINGSVSAVFNVTP
jgi:hypothetical protein